MTKVTELAAPGVSPQATPNPGTTVWVPMWNLAGGSSNAYKGDWAAGTYYPGDHVVYNGILYECVRQTTAAPVPWPPAPGAASYGTTLPASPVDGQEHILVDSVTNPTYQWRFRWNAGSTSAYKWEFVGGAPMQAGISTQQSISGTAYGDLATVGPQLTLPRSGDYTITTNGNCQANANVAYMAPKFGATAVQDGDAVYVYTGTGAASEASVGRTLNYLALAAGTVIKVQYRSSNASPVYFSYRILTITPIRVS